MLRSLIVCAFLAGVALPQSQVCATEAAICVPRAYPKR
jgi:hypothetical protein